MRTLLSLFQNLALLAAGISWISAQVIKTILTFFKTRKFDRERLFGAGGMPSAHSAMVTSLTLGIGKICHINSPEFALAMCFAGVVIYDAMGVRRAAGEHAKVLNRMADAIERTDGEEIIDKELNEMLGHKPLEVLAGVLLGILVWIVIV